MMGARFEMAARMGSRLLAALALGQQAHAGTLNIAARTNPPRAFHHDSFICFFFNLYVIRWD